jgi:hypothetical protein
MACSNRDRQHASDKPEIAKNAAMTIAGARFPADGLLQ